LLSTTGTDIEPLLKNADKTVITNTTWAISTPRSTRTSRAQKQLRRLVGTDAAEGDPQAASIRTVEEEAWPAADFRLPATSSQ
jgi:hypothetical protein